ncbi:hypothetical protein Cgig2_016425 [Carnegiea gigantea]|uniref:Uncharacterized protein n=1 Tax=Carnegiea gigantea TaxID=171969 RepID=A0A9Q1GL44_9CARY|nr:hypothetical protein Cgig2_006844 [Carnegiea gigantea]KAJ8435601.1 hypothetical protein Cgig2_016425 [Carnegiea gigantea]
MKQLKEKQVPLPRKITHSNTKSGQITSARSIKLPLVPGLVLALSQLWIFLSYGGKDGNMPIVVEIFKETHQQKSSTLDEESSNKLPKDVRGPLPSGVELQAQFRVKKKENVSLHKSIDDLEDAHKREIKKLEDQMRIVLEMVMSTQPPLDASRGGATSGSDHDQDD